MILPQVFFTHFASKNQLPGFTIIGRLVENGLIVNLQNTPPDTRQVSKYVAHCISHLVTFDAENQSKSLKFKWNW